MSSPLVDALIAAPSPVISFAGFVTRDDSLLAAWANYRVPLARSASERQAPADPAPGEKVQSHRGPSSPQPQHGPNTPVGFWRLVAANHREIGRSFLLYDDFVRAREHVAKLQSDHDALTVDVVPGPGIGVHGWVLRHRGRPVLMCSRWYDSSSTCAAAAIGARTAFISARLSAAPEVRGRSGRVQRPAPAVVNA